MHGYRSLQNWNTWLSHHFLGNRLIDQEGQVLSRFLNRHYGKHALLIGVPTQELLFQSTLIACHALMSPLTHHHGQPADIESDLKELPILTGSIDLVLLPHTLEYVDNPQHLLAEACRIVKPEGLIVISGFNPYSAWGFKKQWLGRLLHASKIKKWLQLADFELENQQSLLFRPPIKNEKIYQKLHFIERIGSQCLPMLGGAYVIVARAKVVPLTPIRMQWKQRLSGMRISTTISGHIARHSR